MTSIYNFKIEGIDGKTIDLSDFEGQKILIVNVASECGYTPQYQQLQELYEEMKAQVMIIGFPCNDFGAQEPGTNEEIQHFCTSNYGVNFPLTTKISILGNNIHPIYQWLTQKSLNGKLDSQVQWNFHKFLIDEFGHIVKSIPSVQSPFDDEILDWISS